MIEETEEALELSSSDLIRTRWTCGCRHQSLLTDDFRFAQDGAIDKYRNDNPVERAAVLARRFRLQPEVVPQMSAHIALTASSTT